MDRSENILRELEKLYPDAKPALQFESAYELLIAVILSAQCTDERVNKVTRVLFEHYNTPQKMALLSQEELEKIIYPCGFYRMKAQHILSASQDILEKFNGEVPSSREELESLAGVGRKTANVVSSVWFHADAIAVDTHVFRVANRTGLAEGKTPEKVEEGLMKVIPKKMWSKAHHLLIYHGRRICHSQKPDCANCTISKWCKYFQEKEV